MDICNIWDRFLLDSCVSDNGFSVFVKQLSTKYNILLCKKVSYNHILV